MKHYPSIEHWNEDLLGRRVFAFDKLDGSNFRAEWNRKRGWYKFGTKGQMIDEMNEQFGNAIPVFLNKYGDYLPRVFTNQHYKSIRSFVVFCEYLGQNSFAGKHVAGDRMDTVLFDVNPLTKGFVCPEDFIKDFGHLDIPRLVYSGIFTKEFIFNVKTGKYPSLTEGVVVKGINKKDKGKDQVWMVKIKTNQWLEKLKETNGQKALDEEFGNNKNYELKLCNECFQMTNHLNGVCQKHK